MERLPHGYTNFTRFLDRTRVEKRYAGPARWDHARCEVACLTALRGRLPVPNVIDAAATVPVLIVDAIGGHHGQELIDSGHEVEVLRLVGETLRQLQAIDPRDIPLLPGSGSVIVHGDFGPQNMHLDVDRGVVLGVFDWEFAHVGHPVEDLAWAEWIVRMHHPAAVPALPELHAAAGLDLPWPDRQAAMLRQCRDLLGYCESSGMDESAVDWRRRLATTASWQE